MKKILACAALVLVLVASATPASAQFYGSVSADYYGYRPDGLTLSFQQINEWTSNSMGKAIELTACKPQNDTGIACVDSWGGFTLNWQLDGSPFPSGLYRVVAFAEDKFAVRYVYVNGGSTEYLSMQLERSALRFGGVWMSYAAFGSAGGGYVFQVTPWIYSPYNRFRVKVRVSLRTEGTNTVDSTLGRAYDYDVDLRQGWTQGPHRFAIPPHIALQNKKICADIEVADGYTPTWVYIRSTQCTSDGKG